MKKLAISVTVVILFALYGMFRKTVASELEEHAGPVPGTASEETTPQPAATTPQPAAQQSKAYRDGSYLGDAADAFYGNVQVRAVIRSGQLADVEIVQYPNDRRTSMMINMHAMPILRSEAIRAQSANVDIVTGATDSSRAFIASLQSALGQAGK